MPNVHTCSWTLKEHSEQTYNTECGSSCSMQIGTPAQSCMKYCFMCGGLLHELDLDEQRTIELNKKHMHLKKEYTEDELEFRNTTEELKAFEQEFKNVLTSCLLTINENINQED